MKKNDIILIAVILVITLGGLASMAFRQKASTEDTADKAYVLVKIDSEEYGRYPLDEDRQERIELPDGSYNVLVIEDGYVQISEASCRDQICVNHFHIHYAGDAIVCLPNRLVVTIEGGEESDIDSATN